MKDNPVESPKSNVAAGGKWLNRNVFAFGLTSFLSDLCHETATGRSCRNSCRPSARRRWHWD